MEYVQRKNCVVLLQASEGDKSVIFHKIRTQYSTIHRHKVLDLKYLDLYLCL